MGKALRTGWILVVAGLLGLAVLQFHHRSAFGHFFPLTLHADITVTKGDIGIPGITKLYDAHIANYGIMPRRVQRCEFLTDAFQRGMSVAYRLQQWDNSSRRWQTVSDTTADYCRPYPLGMAETEL